jgi:4-carboxymuconolactone decarboxylase
MTTTITPKTKRYEQEDGMAKTLADKTAETAKLYFSGVKKEDLPYNLWREFDPELAREMSLFITGQMYSRQRIPHATRQLVTVAALTALGQANELKVHLHAALNVGVEPRELSEAIFQTGVYAGVPAMNKGLETLKELLEERGEWPIAD